MSDFFFDDFFTELDLVEDPLGATDLPVDVSPADAVAGPEWYSELWFTDLDPGLPDVGAAMSGVPLPDPFQAGAGVGVAGTLARARDRPAGRHVRLARAEARGPAAARASGRR